MTLFRFACALALAAPCGLVHAVEIDGRIDPAEWQDARHVTDFRKTQPLTGEPGIWITR